MLRRGFQGHPASVVPHSAAGWSGGTTVCSTYTDRVTESGPAIVSSPSKQSRTRQVVLAAPRGYCAGVDRAVITVEKALERYGPPVYVRKQIVHNRHVVEELQERGAIFVAELDEVPEGSTVVFSAHGVSPAVQQEAKDRGLKAIDATCPLVTKVHHEARRFARNDLEHLVDRSRGARGGRGDQRRGSRAHHPRAVTR